MTTHTTLSFEVDIYVTKKQHELLERIAAIRKQSVAECLSNTIEPIIGASIEGGELDCLPNDIWQNKRTAAATRILAKDQVLVKTALAYSGNEADVIGSLMPLIQKYYPALFDIFAVDGTRSRLESATEDDYHIPKEEAEKLLVDWKLAMVD